MPTYLDHDHGWSADTKPLDPKIEAHLKRMARPVRQQAIIDRLAALVFLGKVNPAEAQRAVAAEDWSTVRRLIRGTRHTKELPR